MNRSLGYVQTFIEWTIGALLAVMVVLVFANAAGRYLLNTGLAASEEIARLAFVWMIFLGAILAVRERSHVGVDMLVKRLPRWGQRLCLLVTNLAILYGLWLFAEGSWQQVIVGLNSRLPVTDISLAAFAAAGLVSAIAMGLLIAGDLVRLVTGRLGEDELVQVRESADGEEIREYQHDFADADTSAAQGSARSGKPS